MKRVLLVAPNVLQVPYPVPPLGLCQVARALADRYDVYAYDALSDGGDGLAQTLADFAPDYVGLGVRNVDNTVMSEPRFFVDEIRDRFVQPVREHTAAPLVVGGSGFSIFPDAMLAALGADYGVVGEGEQTMPALLQALDEGNEPVDLAGVVVRGREST